jgi:hypothetical protein
LVLVYVGRGQPEDTDLAIVGSVGVGDVGCTEARPGRGGDDGICGANFRNETRNYNFNILPIVGASLSTTVTVA